MQGLKRKSIGLSFGDKISDDSTDGGTCPNFSVQMVPYCRYRAQNANKIQLACEAMASQAVEGRALFLRHHTWIVFFVCFYSVQ